MRVDEACHDASAAEIDPKSVGDDAGSTTFAVERPLAQQLLWAVA